MQVETNVCGRPCESLIRGMVFVDEMQHIDTAEVVCDHEVNSRQMFCARTLREPSSEMLPPSRHTTFGGLLRDPVASRYAADPSVGYQSIGLTGR